MTHAPHGERQGPAATDTASRPVQDIRAVRVPATVLAEHQAAVAAIREAYAAIPPGSPVRLAKRTSNLFRFRDPLPRQAAGDGPAGRRAAPG